MKHYIKFITIFLLCIFFYLPLGATENSLQSTFLPFVKPVGETTKPIPITREIADELKTKLEKEHVFDQSTDTIAIKGDITRIDNILEIQTSPDKGDIQKTYEYACTIMYDEIHILTGDKTIIIRMGDSSGEGKTKKAARKSAVKNLVNESLFDKAFDYFSQLKLSKLSKDLEDVYKEYKILCSLDEYNLARQQIDVVQERYDKLKNDIQHLKTTSQKQYKEIKQQIYEGYQQLNDLKIKFQTSLKARKDKQEKERDALKKEQAAEKRKKKEKTWVAKFMYKVKKNDDGVYIYVNETKINKLSISTGNGWRMIPREYFKDDYDNKIEINVYNKASYRGGNFLSRALKKREGWNCEIEFDISGQDPFTIKDGRSKNIPDDEFGNTFTIETFFVRLNPDSRKIDVIDKGKNMIGLKLSNDETEIKNSVNKIVTFIEKKGEPNV